MSKLGATRSMKVDDLGRTWFYGVLTRRFLVRPAPIFPVWLKDLGANLRLSHLRAGKANELLMEAVQLTQFVDKEISAEKRASLLEEVLRNSNQIVVLKTDNLSSRNQFPKLTWDNVKYETLSEDN